jgi:LEA14-like dessication related protein
MSKKFSSKNNIIVIQLYLIIILVASSCGVRDLATGRIAPPKVAFQGLSIYPPESQCWPLSARLQLTNPNPEPLRITGYDYELSVEGAELVQGESVDAITLPANGESLVEVPILLKLKAVPKTLKTFLLQERLKYELSGGFRLDSVMGGFLRVPFRFRGEITRQEGLERLRKFFTPKQ